MAEICRHLKTSKSADISKNIEWTTFFLKAVMTVNMWKYNFNWIHAKGFWNVAFSTL